MCRPTTRCRTRSISATPGRARSARSASSPSSIPSLDPRSVRLQDLKIGDINIHVPADLAVFQADFDFSGNKGFVLRVSAGVDSQTRVATWLIQAIDPDTGEVLRDPKRGLLLPDANGNPGRGFVGYTVKALGSAVTGTAIDAQARVFLDDSPPIESAGVSHTLDAAAPATALTVRSAGNDGNGAPIYDVAWRASDDASGVKAVTIYVAADGGDFRIWKRQVAGDAGQAVFTGEAGKTYEFLAAAVDNAGNREAALVTHAVLPDDGSRQDAQQALGANDTVASSEELPAATPDRTYPANAIFQQATLRLPGFVAPAQPGDLQSVLAPMTVRGFASGFSGSEGDIGALAMVELADGGVLASAGELRNQVFRFDKTGGRSTTPLFELDSPGPRHGGRRARPAVGDDRQRAAPRRRDERRRHRAPHRARRRSAHARDRDRSRQRPDLRLVGQRHRDLRPARGGPRRRRGSTSRTRASATSRSAPTGASGAFAGPAARSRAASPTRPPRSSACR
jgi:hypothetical protein